MAIEECSELIKAILKLRRKERDNDGYLSHLIADIIEETADVIIMCEQIKLMYPQFDIKDVIDKKIQRLSKRL